jgi:hypothetical protein
VCGEVVDVIALPTMTTATSHVVRKAVLTSHRRAVLHVAFLFLLYLLFVCYCSLHSSLCGGGDIITIAALNTNIEPIDVVGATKATA